MSEKKGNGFLIGALIGAAAGVVAGLLTAPASGAETRKTINKKVKRLYAREKRD